MTTAEITEIALEPNMSVISSSCSPLPGSPVPTGIESVLMTAAAEKMGCTLNWTRITWGWYDEDGNWNGMLGMVTLVTILQDVLRKIQTIGTTVFCSCCIQPLFDEILI